MSRVIHRHKHYEINIFKESEKISLKSFFPNEVEDNSTVSYNNENITLKLDFKEFIKVVITSNFNILNKLIVEIAKDCEISELLLAGYFDNILLKGNCSYISFIGGCDYFNVEIQTDNLPKLGIDEAYVHDLKLTNQSENTTIYMGVSPHLDRLTTNQKNIYIYKHTGYDNLEINSDSNTKIRYIYLDPEKQDLDF